MREKQDKKKNEVTQTAHSEIIILSPFIVGWEEKKSISSTIYISDFISFQMLRKLCFPATGTRIE